MGIPVYEGGVGEWSSRWCGGSLWNRWSSKTRSSLCLVDTSLPKPGDPGLLGETSGSAGYSSVSGLKAPDPPHEVPFCETSPDRPRSLHR